MRVAAQEGIGAGPHDAGGTRGAGGAAGSAGGAFLALLALLQNGGAAGEVAVTPGTPDASGADGEPSDAADPVAGNAAAEGVVVTLSVAANTTAAAIAVTPDAGTQAPAGTSGAAAVASAQAAASGAVVQGFAAIAGGTADPGPSTGEGPGFAGHPPTTDGATALVADAAAKPAKVDTAALARSTHGSVANGAAALAGTAAARPGREARGAGAHTTAGTEAGNDAPGAPTSSDAAATTAATASSDRTAAQQALADEATHGRVRRAADGARHEPRIADGDDDVAADDDAFAAPRGTTGGGVTRELPAGVRVLSEPLPLQSGQAHGAQHGAIDGARADVLAATRGDAATGSDAGSGTTRVRASGFAAGEAGLPSWVERLASPEGLAATRRGNTLHLDLEPNGLGRIELRLSFGRDGVRASVLTEHEHTRTLLASQQPQLAAALERNDVRLESFLVDVGTQSGGDGREAWRDASDFAGEGDVGLVHAATSDSVLDEQVPLARGLVNVRA